MTLGQKLTNLRKARGMTQEELSEAIGITRQTISKWELDTPTPDLDYLCKLCDLFGCTADYLLGRSASPLPVISPADAAVLDAYHALPLELRRAVDGILAPYRAAASEKKDA